MVVALIAFSQAADTYGSGSGSSLKYAEVNIRSRFIGQLRKQFRFKPEYTVSSEVFSV